MEKRYDIGFRDGAEKVIVYFKYNLAGSRGSHIETELLNRWIEKAERKFLSRD
jgi:hypothetical protein